MVASLGEGLAGAGLLPISALMYDARTDAATARFLSTLSPAGRDAAEELRGNKEFVMEVLQMKAYALLYVAEELKADKELAFLAVSIDEATFEFISSDLRTNHDFVKEVARRKAEDSAFYCPGKSESWNWTLKV